MVEAERAAIAADIHDGLLPYLYAAAAQIAALRRSDEQLHERLSDAAQWIDQSREVARALMNGITYPPLALADPLAAAKAFVEQVAMASEGGITGHKAAPLVHWGWDDDRSPLAGQLPPTSAVAIYRLTCEFVRNSLRHAQAEHIEVSGSILEDAAVVCIQDDGVGFHPSDVDTSSSHGLALARRRAVAGNIELQIESSRKTEGASSRGTQVTLRTALSIEAPSPVPIQPPAAGHR